MKKDLRGFGFVIYPMVFILFFASMADAQERPVSVSAQKMTLDIKGMDIIDVLKIISQRTGMNIVASKGLSGKVTIFLKEVDAWDAFEIILLANDLAYESNADIITVMSGREYETLHGERFKDKKEVRLIKLNYANASEVAKALTQVKTAIGRVVVDPASNTLVLMETPERMRQMEDMIKMMDVSIATKVFSLDYADSDKLNTNITDMITKGVGSVRFDERTNKIAVTDLPEKVKEIEEVITAFDEKTRQVLIDAKIVQVELNDKFQAGIDWKVVFKNVLETFTIEETLASGLTTGGKLTIATVFGKHDNTLNAILDFLKDVGKTNIISSPRITALDGQEAKILVGTKEAYITATTTTPATGATTTAEAVNFVDVGVQLYVTPNINKEGYVSMKIKPVISSVGSRIKTTASPEGVPIVKTSEAETSILVRDGMTIVMGGLMEDKTIRSSSRIPLLGDIPILGFPFRKTSNEIKKTELVIFLTPTVISGDFSESIPDMKDNPVYSGYYEKVRKNILSKTLYYEQIRNKILDTAKKHLSENLSILPPAQMGSPQFGAVVPAEPGEADEINVEAIVSFTLSSDGSIRDEPILVNHVSPLLGDLIIRSVQESSPFAPFPDFLRKDSENFKIRISFE